MRKIIVMCLILAGLVAGFFVVMTAASGAPRQVTAGPTPDPVGNTSLKAEESVKAEPEPEDEDTLDLKAMRDQMNKERGIQQQIKLHSLELEQTKVQLEQEKALAEMNQLRKANLGIVRDPNGNGTLSLPDTKVVFLSASEKAKEAILTINGSNYTVKEGDKPLENLVVKAITEKGVTIVVNGDKEILLTPNLME